MVKHRKRKIDFMKKFYISTALPYVNYSPHAGFALELVQADVLARYHRLLGEDVFFLSGTDENSLKNVQVAEKEGIEVKEFVDRNAQKFYDLKKESILNLSFDDFIRTTEKRHIEGAQKLWLACQKDIYKKKYQGLYCLGCEEFYKEDELVNGLCPEHKTKPELIEEENYFFRLAKYQKQLKKIIGGNQIEIIPQTRKNEILSFIDSGLQDFCISRSAERGRGWGIPVPGDSSQIIWTWFDALSNYINALGYAGNSDEFQEWWQKNENKLHVIGKGILRFHGIYWIAMLLSANLVLPRTIFVHGYLTYEGRKMSKSLGNIVDPFELVKKYGTDPVRYYLLREFASTEDGDFSIKRFEERYNADLANGLGNLVSRVLALSEKVKPVKPDSADDQLAQEIKLTQEKYRKAMEEIKFNEALEVIWQLISAGDEFVDRNKIWELVKTDSEKAKKDLGALSNALKEISRLLKPFMPETSQKIMVQVKRNKKTEALFPRL